MTVQMRRSPAWRGEGGSSSLACRRRSSVLVWRRRSSGLARRRRSSVLARRSHVVGPGTKEEVVVGPGTEEEVVGPGAKEEVVGPGVEDPRRRAWRGGAMSSGLARRRRSPSGLARRRRSPSRLAWRRRSSGLERRIHVVGYHAPAHQAAPLPPTPSYPGERTETTRWLSTC